MNPKESTIDKTPMKIPKAAKSILRQWMDQGVRCEYVKFQNDFKAVHDGELTGEMKLGARQGNKVFDRNRCDEIIWTHHAVIIRIDDRLCPVSLSNVAFARAIER